MMAKQTASPAVTRSLEARIVVVGLATDAKFHLNGSLDYF